MTPITMSSNDDHTHTGASGLRGRRGGRTFRGRSRGHGYRFGLNAQLALTQHLMRNGRSLLPPATDAISLTIGNFHDAPLNARRLDKNVYPNAVDRDNVLEADPVYLHHPSPPQDLQSPLSLTPLSPEHSPLLIENQYLTGSHSAKDPNVNSYTIFVYLPNDADHKTLIKTILTNHLAYMQSAGLPTSPEGLDALQVQENSTYPVKPEYDDKPITNTTQVTPSQLNNRPYSFTITLPTFSTATYGLLFLASKQTRWSTRIPKTLIPSFITQTIRQAIMQKTPTTKCYRTFSTYALHTIHKLVTTIK
jgi:hypothetical protein